MNHDAVIGRNLLLGLLGLVLSMLLLQYAV